jgi:hypothetical protein
MELEKNVIELEGASSPDIHLMDEESVLLDVSQGFRDLGLVGLILRHKGRLIVTTKRIIYFKKKTKDFEIEQLNISHSGYISLGFNFNFKQMLIGALLGALSIFLFVSGNGETIIPGIVALIIGLFIILTARLQCVSFFGSGNKIIFASKAISIEKLAKAITIVSANS